MVDLHLHTTCSDGRDSPEALVERAAGCGLKAIAITDHDTVAGVIPARRAAEMKGCAIRIVSGVELSTMEGRTPVHVLGYGMDPAHRVLAFAIGRIRDERRARAVAILERLRATNVEVSMAAVEYVADEAPITRAHIAEALVIHGSVATYREAFARYLADETYTRIPPSTLSPTDAIRIIHEAGGVAVLAHPVLTRRDELIAGLVRNGLDGIETIHPTHTPASERFYRGLAAKYGLIVTGGSDWHGTGRGRDIIGARTAPTWMLAELLRAIEERREAGRGKPFEKAVPSVS